jgi:predicted DNA-binding protein
MSDEKPKKEKKGKRMVDTNVRITKSTHSRLKYLAEALGVTMSEIVDAMIYEKHPDIDSRINAREQEAKELRRHIKKPDNSN